MDSKPENSVLSVSNLLFGFIGFMENNIPAPRDGKVTAIHVSAGNSVMQGDALIDIE